MSHILAAAQYQSEKRETEREREGGGIETVGQRPTYMCGSHGKDPLVEIL